MLAIFFSSQSLVQRWQGSPRRYLIVRSQVQADGLSLAQVQVGRCLQQPPHQHRVLLLVRLCAQRPYRRTLQGTQDASFDICQGQAQGRVEIAKMSGYAVRSG